MPHDILLFSRPSFVVPGPSSTEKTYLIVFVDRTTLCWSALRLKNRDIEEYKSLADCNNLYIIWRNPNKMKREMIIFLLLVFSVASVSAVKINEFTVDPQTDWDGSGGNATSSDEWIELYNDGGDVNLSGWRIEMNDGTNEVEFLNDFLADGDFLTIVNPDGVMNNNGQILLFDSSDTLIDSVSYGDFDDGNLSDNAPDGNAVDATDECLARENDGVDSNIDALDFVKQSCTFGYRNSAAGGMGGSQGLNATIGGVVSVEILPTTIQFGTVASGSTDNPALNGPVTFDASGSNTNVQIEVLGVTGELFATGLKFDGASPIGLFWELMCQLNEGGCSHDIVSVVPTLDVFSGALPGTQSGTVEYLITGTPS